MLPVGLLRQFGSLATSITIATRRRLSRLRRLIDTIDSISIYNRLQLGNPKWRIAVNDADFEISPTGIGLRARPLQNTNKWSKCRRLFFLLFHRHQRPHSSLGQQLKATLLRGVLVPARGVHEEGPRRCRGQTTCWQIPLLFSRIEWCANKL